MTGRTDGSGPAPIREAVVRLRLDQHTQEITWINILKLLNQHLSRGQKALGQADGGSTAARLMDGIPVRAARTGDCFRSN